MGASSDNPLQPVSAFRAGIQRLYAGLRPHFWPALSVLLTAAMCVVGISASLCALNVLFGLHLAVDVELLGTFVAMVATAELVKGCWKLWRGRSAADWYFPAIAAGGAALGLVFSVLQALRWGVHSWIEYANYIIGGMALYLLLGWVIRQQERREQEQANDT